MCPKPCFKRLWLQVFNDPWPATSFLERLHLVWPTPDGQSELYLLQTALLVTGQEEPGDLHIVRVWQPPSDLITLHPPPPSLCILHVFCKPYVACNSKQMDAEQKITNPQEAMLKVTAVCLEICSLKNSPGDPEARCSEPLLSRVL